MNYSELLRIVPSSLPLSITVWCFIFIIVFFFLKFPLHAAIRKFSLIIHDGFLKMAESMTAIAEKLANRNKEILVYTGGDDSDNLIKKEYYRVTTIIERDLSGFPELKKALMEQIARMDKDFDISSNVPPPPSEWVNAVESLEKVAEHNTGSKAINTMLKEIYKTTNSQFKSAMDEYRKTVAENHKELHRLMPYWRKLATTLDHVTKAIAGLMERATAIDKTMDEYKKRTAKYEKSQRILSTSSLTQFLISGIVLSIAVAGAIINFNLIALPMSEMVGGGSTIGAFKTSEVAAMIIILVEVAMGLFFMESLRITHLFPVINQLDDRMRKRMMWITLTILIILAGIEASLALMRDQIAANNQVLLQSLAGTTTAAQHSMIPTVGQTILGFILPFILTFVAIPLESFIHASRTVLGNCIIAILNIGAFTLSLFGRLSKNLGELLTHVYNIFIFPAIWIEDLVKNVRK